jgi:hypothetical protein
MISLKSKHGNTNLEFADLLKKFQSGEYETLKKTYESFENIEEKKKFSKENIPKYSPSFVIENDNKRFFSNLIAIKIELLDDDSFKKIKENKYVLCSYISFTSKKRILIVKVNQLPESNFEIAKNQITEYYKKELDIQIKSVEEWLFVTHDLEIYSNPQSSIFKISDISIVDENGHEDKVIIEKLNKTKKMIDKISKNTITFGKPILFRNHEKVIFPNSISVIQGKSGVHKSRFTQHICSTFIEDSTDPLSSKNLLGFKSEKSNHIVYIDTERSINEQFPSAIQDIKVNANFLIEENIKELDFYSLIEFKRKERTNVIKKLIKNKKHQTDKHIVVILDVATDLIADFNSVDDSMTLIDFLNECINAFDISFIVLIHENPGFQTDKARGHLGTELMNKATTQLSIKEEKQINDVSFFKVSYLKCRNSKKYPPYFVRFDENEKHLVEVSEEELTEIKNARNTKADINDIAEFIPEIFEVDMTQANLIKLINLEFKTSNKTTRERLTEIENKPIKIIDKDGLPYKLIRTSKKPVKYGLELIPETENT